MNLRPRGVAGDAAAAALDVAAAGRFLAGAGITGGRILVIEDGVVATGVTAEAVAAAWSSGEAVVRVRGSAARDAALATAQAFGLHAHAEPAEQESGDDVGGRADADRLAARFELGLEPDETVELVLGAAALRDLADRLSAFDATLAADPTPRRLVLAGLPDHGPALEPDLIAAIVHPQVLVESEPSTASLLAMLHRAADEVVDD